MFSLNDRFFILLVLLFFTPSARRFQEKSDPGRPVSEIYPPGKEILVEKLVKFVETG